jgi:hypothetical protein
MRWINVGRISCGEGRDGGEGEWGVGRKLMG